MTGRPPPEEERDLDRWVQEATEGWRMPPLTQGRIPWQARIASKRSSESRGPVTIPRGAAGALGAAAVVAIALIVLGTSLPARAPVAPGNDQEASASPTEHSPSERPSAEPPSAEPPIAEPPSATESDERFRVTIRADKARYEANEPIVITTSLEYLGTEATVTSSGGGLVAFLIEQLDGPIDTGGDRDDSCEQHRFRRGDIEPVEFQKSGGYSPEDPMGDFWRRFYDDPQLRLPAGTYRITAEAQYGPPECAPTQQVAASIVIEVVDAPDPTVTPPVNGTRHLRLDGIELDYPASWTANDQGWPSTGFGWTVAVIGTLPWGPCARHDLNCHYQQRLQPGQISVDIGQLFLSREDICQLGRTRSDLEGRGPENPIATGSLARVDGRPALRTDYDVRQADYYRSDEWRSWVITVPGSVDRAFTIHAKYRGPGVARMRRELDELIASIRLSPASEPEPGPEDCGPPFPPP